MGVILVVRINVTVVVPLLAWVVVKELAPIQIQQVLVEFAIRGNYFF